MIKKRAMKIEQNKKRKHRSKPRSKTVQQTKSRTRRYTPGTAENLSFGFYTGVYKKNKKISTSSLKRWCLHIGNNKTIYIYIIHT